MVRNFKPHWTVKKKADLEPLKCVEFVRFQLLKGCFELNDVIKNRCKNFQ